MSALDAVLFVAADNDVTKRAARELAALRAELKQTQSDRQREHELRCQLAGEVEALRARVAKQAALLADLRDAIDSGDRFSYVSGPLRALLDAAIGDAGNEGEQRNG